MNKKIYITLLLLIIGFSVTACIPTRLPGSELSVLSSTISNYGGDMTAKQYIIANNEQNASLKGIATYEDRAYFSYYIGDVQNIPFYTSELLQCEELNQKYTFSFGGFDKDSVLNRINNLISAMSVNSNGANVHYASEGNDITNITGDVLKEIETSKNSLGEHDKSDKVIQRYVDKYNDGTKIKVIFKEDKGFNANYYYRVIFLETISVYAILCYDAQSSSYYVTYDYIISNSDSKTVLEEFSNSQPTIVSDNLYFDLYAAVENANLNMPILTTDIYIRNADQFVNYMSQDTTSKKFYLSSDINLSGRSLNPFSDFAGTLDGRGYTIKGWNKQFNSLGNTGLFYSVSGTISNLTLSNFTIYENNPDINGNAKIGFLCGTNNGIITSVNVYDSTARVDLGDTGVGANNHASLGAICGQNNGVINGNGKISNVTLSCKAFSQYEDAFSYVGGVCGESYYGEITGYKVYDCSITAYSSVAVDKNIFACWNHGRPYAYAAGIVGVKTETKLGSDLTTSGNSVSASINRDCNHTENKGSSTGTIYAK